MLTTPQPHGSVVVPIPSVAPKVFHNKQNKDANNNQGIDSMLHQPHLINNCVVLSGSEKSGSVKGGLCRRKSLICRKGNQKGVVVLIWMTLELTLELLLPQAGLRLML
ncbi:hypothetical protein AABB24_038479 [Solanum stoloniferum]|uniref:Uncharacterized protein n=1 Tax=Solanum stoloniferum TaxID=62892 RepID=A0ABD2QXT7_9SOLN